MKSADTTVPEKTKTRRGYAQCLCCALPSFWTVQERVFLAGQPPASSMPQPRCHPGHCAKVRADGMVVWAPSLKTKWPIAWRRQYHIPLLDASLASSKNRTGAAEWRRACDGDPRLSFWAVYTWMALGAAHVSWLLLPIIRPQGPRPKRGQIPSLLRPPT